MFLVTRNCARSGSNRGPYINTHSHIYGGRRFFPLFAQAHSRRLYSERFDENKQKGVEYSKINITPDIAHLGRGSEQDLLSKVAYEEDVKVIENLFNAVLRSDNMNAIDKRDEFGRNFLHLAVIRGNLEILEFLLKDKSPFDINEDLDNRGLSAFHWAIHQKNGAVVEKLLDNGASLTTPWKDKDNGGEIYPLEMAISVGSPEILDLLLKSDRQNQLDLGRMSLLGSILHIAIHSNENEMLEHLLTTHFDKVETLLERVDAHKRTPLQLAASLNDCRAIELLIKTGKVDINKGEGEEGGTALHYAASNHSFEAIQTLDYHGANLSALNVNHKPPIELIAKDGTLKSKQCRTLLNKISRKNRIEKTLPPNFSKRPPHNIVFQGGGPRGIAYVGALKEMEATGVLTDLRRVAGTSAGAITAALLAIGYTPQEIESALYELDFLTLLDPDPNDGKAQDVVNLSDLGRRAPSLREASKLALRHYWQQLRKNPIHPVDAAKDLMKEYNQILGLCKGEKLREKIEELISKKTGTQYLTFGELRELVEKEPDKYKHLYAVATRFGQEGHIQLDTFSSDELSQDFKSWGDLIISDALRASASIPGVFKPHVLHYKDEVNGRHSRNPSVKYVDGGLVKNYPLEIFDDEKYQEDRYNHGKKTNRRTLGFSLVDISEEILKPPVQEDLEKLTTASEIAKMVGLTFYHAEEIIRRHEGSTGRTIEIPVELGLIDSFHATKKQKDEMVKSGKESAVFFFDQR